MERLRKLIAIGAVACAAFVGCTTNAPETPASGAPAGDNPGNQGSDNKKKQGSDTRPNEEKPAEAPGN